ncbi:MAG: hypothetical protein WHV66_12340 [Anaerolineales bacterium]|jgi:hypothetical protein
MKKLYLLLLPAWFAMCAVAGFLLFYTIGRFTTSSPSPSQQRASTFNTQYNMLIIHVDSLQKEKANVQGTWMLFVTLSHPPNIILKQLNTRSSVMELSDSSDSLEAGKEIHQKSIDQLVGLNIPWHGYVIFDDEGRERLLSALVSAMSIRQEITSASRKSSWTNNNLCDVLISMPSFFETVGWSELVPEHFQTDIEISELLVIYDLIYHSTPPPDCKEIEK